MPDKNNLEKANEKSDKYNKILEFYVESQDGDLDIVGLIAYSLYKRQKRDWIVKHRLENDGNRPTSEEIDAVTNTYLTEDLRETLRDRATNFLTTYAEAYVEALTPEIREDALADEQVRQAQSIETEIKNNAGFWRQVWTGLIATIIWTGILSIIIAAAWLFGSDVLDGWQTLNGS